MTKSLYFTITCISLLFLSLAMTTAAQSKPVDDFVREQMRQWHIPGLSLVIVSEGKIVKAQGYGLANVELNAPATAETVYEIGSVTKQFTSTAVMILVHDKKLALDDAVGKYLFDLPAAWRPITVRQLLNQTSGIKDYFDDGQPSLLEAAHFPAAEALILKNVVSLPLIFQPGAAYNYSNTNHYLLGLLIEKVSGKKYADFLRQRIFTPAGMNDTRVNDQRVVIARRAAGYNYDWARNALIRAESVDAAWSFAAGGIVSTVADLAKWDAALDSNLLVSNPSKKEMWTAGKLSNGIPHRYGFGWYVDLVNGHPNLSHGGDIPGFATYYSRYPKDRLTIIISMNQYIYPKRIADKIAEMYVPSLRYRSIADEDPPFTALARKLYAGLADGDLVAWDEKLFTPDAWKSLRASFSNAENLDFYQRLGAAKAIDLVERVEDERGAVLTRYRASYTNNARIIKFVRNRAGLISEWEDYEE